MKPIRRRRALAGLAVTLVVLAFAGTPAARAQFPGYGWGYGGMGYDYGMYGSPYGMYGSPYGYGYPGVSYGYGAMGYGYGYPGMGMGYGYPGMGYGYVSPYAFGYPGVNYAGPLIASPYANSLFGVGLSPLGVNSYFTEMNQLGRGQIQAYRRVPAPLIRRGDEKRKALANRGGQGVGRGPFHVLRDQPGPP